MSIYSKNLWFKFKNRSFEIFSGDNLLLLSETTSPALEKTLSHGTDDATIFNLISASFESTGK